MLSRVERAESLEENKSLEDENNKDNETNQISKLLHLNVNDEFVENSDSTESPMLKVDNEEHGKDTNEIKVFYLNFLLASTLFFFHKYFIFVGK